MRLIDKLVLKDLIGPFFNGLAMFTILVFSVAFLPQAMDALLQGAGIAIVLKLILLMIPEVITQTLPMAMLLSGLLGFGRLSGDSECVAIFACGISFPRAARTVIIGGVIVSAVAFLWNDYVVPPCKLEFVNARKQLATTVMKSDRPLDYPIRNNDNTLDKFVTISGFDATTRSLKGVNIVQYSRDPKRKGQIEAELYCNRAYAKDLKAINDWVYYDGRVTIFAADAVTGSVDSVSVTQFKEMRSSPQTLSPGRSFSDVLGSDITDPSARNFRDLHKDILLDRRQGRFVEARGKEVNLYGKIALPLAGMIFGILGAALGCSTKRGGSKTVGFGMAVFIVFLYYVFYRSMWVVGQNGGMPPMLASFLADIVGLVIAIGLAINASR